MTGRRPSNSRSAIARDETASRPTPRVSMADACGSDARRDLRLSASSGGSTQKFFLSPRKRLTSLPGIG